MAGGLCRLHQQGPVPWQPVMKSWTYCPSECSPLVLPSCVWTPEDRSLAGEATHLRGVGLFPASLPGKLRVLGAGMVKVPFLGLSSPSLQLSTPSQVLQLALATGTLELPGAV